MLPLEIRSILIASDLLENSDEALRSAAALAERLEAEIHVFHALDIPVSGYPGTGVTLDFQRQIHDARRMLREQAERTLPEGVRLGSLHIAVDRPHAAILHRARQVNAQLIVLGPHRPRAFRGPILGNTADRLLRSSEIPVLILPEPLRLPLRRVVAPMDLSDPARGALDQGLLWAGALGARDAASAMPQAEVRVMHVIPRIYEAYDFPFDRAVIGPQLNQEIEAAIARVGGAADVEVREEVVWGNAPAEEIVRYVETEGADLLVLGTHGYGALGRALIGSVTSSVARSAPCPMLLVPPPVWRVAEPDTTAETAAAGAT